MDIRIGCINTDLQPLLPAELYGRVELLFLRWKHWPVSRHIVLSYLDDYQCLSCIPV